MELITGLLERDPEKRYTIEEALEHPWTRGETASSKIIMPHIIQSLLAFQNRSKFKMEALRRVAKWVYPGRVLHWVEDVCVYVSALALDYSKFSANQMKHIRTAFLDMDTDRTGTVTIRVRSLRTMECGNLGFELRC
jgi:serine/threonine protein kinase